jgi:hypothetical protein
MVDINGRYNSPLPIGDRAECSPVSAWVVAEQYSCHLVKSATYWPPWRNKQWAKKWVLRKQFQLALWAEETKNCSQTSCWWDHFREPAYTRWPIPPRKEWAQTPWADSPKAVRLGGATSIATQPSISTLRRNRDTEKAPVKSVSTWIWNQRKKTELLANWFFYSFIHICIHCLGHFSPLSPYPTSRQNLF